MKHGTLSRYKGRQSVKVVPSPGCRPPKVGDIVDMHTRTGKYSYVRLSAVAKVSRWTYQCYWSKQSEELSELYEVAA